MIGSTGDENIAIGQQRGAWPTASGCHLSERTELLCRWIVKLSGICGPVPHPSAGNKYFPGGEKNGYMSDTSDAHVATRLKLASSRIVGFYRTIASMIESHA